MQLTDYLTEEIGRVFTVDTQKIHINILKEENMNLIRINDLLIMNGNDATEKLIGLVTKVSKKINNDVLDEPEADNDEISTNFCVASLIGTFYTKLGTKENVFKRVINTYPEINSCCYRADRNTLPYIMNALKDNSTSALNIGKYSNDKTVDAILDGNKFFQRHAAIVGSTGSGKSYTVANILERANELSYSNIILFDLHGEYNEFSYAKQLKISSNGGLHIPLWFFNYEEIHSLFIESSEGTSSNQRAAVVDYILKSKKKYISDYYSELSGDVVTADTPIPFSASQLLEYLKMQNILEEETGETYKTGEKAGMHKTRQGQYYGKLTNLITRLQTKFDDKKYSFIFDEDETKSHKYLNKFVNELLSFDDKNIKIVDLSEVPSDILAIVIGIITRIIYDVQFWNYPNSKDEQRHPIALICDEAHIYMPSDNSKLKATEKKSLEVFETIAKEGRKYGVGLLIVSQRPAELNQTIFSQCNNIMALKITNDRDKNSVASMLTDSLVGVVDLLPTLDVGECIVVGDAILIPTKILLRSDLKEIPKSTTIDFWDRWSDKENTVFDYDSAILNMIRQTGTKLN